MQVRAKMICHAVVPGYGNNVTVHMNPVYNNKDGTRAEENKAFSDATPSGSVILNIDGSKPAAQEFKQGDTYYVDFTKVE